MANSLRQAPLKTEKRGYEDRAAYGHDHIGQHPQDKPRRSFQHGRPRCVQPEIQTDISYVTSNFKQSFEAERWHPTSARVVFFEPQH